MVNEFGSGISWITPRAVQSLQKRLSSMPRCWGSLSELAKGPEVKKSNVA